MHGYQNGLEGGLLEYVSKKYRSHRRIPDNVFQEGERLHQLRTEYEEKIRIKIEKKSKLKAVNRPSQQ
jgi:hypothetical protein